MKRNLYLIVLLTMLGSITATAQNCPVSPTYLNKAGTYNLSAGLSVAINNGGTYSFTVQNVFAATASICVTNGSTLNLSFQNLNTVEKGGSIYVDKTSKLNITGNGINSFPFTLVNAGTVTQSIGWSFADGAAVNNSGTYTLSSASYVNSGAVSILNSGTFNVTGSLTFNGGTTSFVNTAAGTVTFSKDVTLSNLTMVNAGTMNFNGSATLQNLVTVTNNGYMYMKNTTANSAVFNSSTVTNNGVMQVSGSVATNAGAVFTNGCTIKIAGNFSNNSTFTNNGNLLLTILSGSTFLNQGPFINGSSGFVQGSVFNNNNNISGGGNFYFTGSTTNQGPFAGSIGSTINFYDVSNSSTRYFDIQNTAPQSTTKNTILPNTNTTFTACAATAPPAIITQPAVQYLCDSSVTSATFSVAVKEDNTKPSYQWYKNGTAVTGATTNTYTATGLVFTDSNNAYMVKVSNDAGTTSSSNAGIKYIITTQPSPVTAVAATGGTVTFNATASSAATGFQWYQNGIIVAGATSSSYKISPVTVLSAGSYAVRIQQPNGYCTTAASKLTAALVFYSKATGDLRDLSTWGTGLDGSGVAPVSFTQPEYTFVVANRTATSIATSLNIAGTYDLGDKVTTLAPGSVLEVGRIIRSKATGYISAHPTAELIVHGKSDLYFDPLNKVLKALTINTTDTVRLRTALHLIGGTGHGILKVLAGVFHTGDSLTLKSDSLGTASVGNSPGNILGKVTVERFIPARRAWRLFTSPVSDSLAPTIHDAWQEGAVNSTDNPKPGYGTHITYGNEADGFDQNPQKTFSIKVKGADGRWTGIPNTNKTKVTDYPVYFLFIRGDRSYDIKQTTNKVTARPTIIRTTGYLRQHVQQARMATGNGYKLLSNPYASPVDFESIYKHSSGIAHHVWIWNPALTGERGVGGYMLAYWNGSGYSTTPALPKANNLRFLQAYQGFFIESSTTSPSLSFDESDKDTSSFSTPFGREVAGDISRLEVNLNIINDDSTTSPADGAAFLFNSSFNDSLDDEDIVKMTGSTESSGILRNGKLLAVEQRSMPADKDSLQLSLTNTKSGKYELQLMSDHIGSTSFSLYDRFLGTKTPLSSTDTSRIIIDINGADPASSAANRFVIVSKVAPQQAVMFTEVSAAAKENTILVNWSTVNEANVSAYRVERSADGTSFTGVSAATAAGKKTYSFTDSKPLQGLNYYRIRSVTKTNAITYSGVVSESVAAAGTQSTAAVYPNPLTSNHCIIDLRNKPAGKYDLTLSDNAGTVVFTTSITTADGNSKQALLLPAELPQGTYHLKIESTYTKEIIKLVSLY